MCIYIYIYTYVHAVGPRGRVRDREVGRGPGQESLRPVRLLRVWVSKGLTQADS